ncbi:MAG: hypothetical protein ACKODT_07235 [Fluviibacter sp.]
MTASLRATNGSHPGSTNLVIPTGFSVGIEVISTNKAAQWLETYKGPNRNTSDNKVLQFQSDMESGRWHFEGAPIRLGGIPERLLDGKHRLTALANTVPDMEFPFVVERGLTAESQLYMDQGQARTVSQQLALRGIGKASVYGAAAKLYLDWTRNRLFSSATRATTSKPEVVEWVLANQELLAQLSQTNFNQIEAPQSVSGAFGLSVLQHSPVRGFRFLNKLSTGTSLAEGDPILALDRRLRNIRRGGVKTSQREYLAYFIKAWNAWVMGDRLVRMQLSPLTENNFPELFRVTDH